MQKTSALLKDTGVRQRADIKMVQNMLFIWLDNDIDAKKKDCRNTVA